MIPSKEIVQSLYEDALQRGLTLDVQGWHFEEPIFRTLMEQVRPRVYVEVGCHKGASVIRVATLARQLGLDFTCYAIDFWTEPGMFEQFLFNIRSSGFSDVVIPLKCSSLQGAEELKRAGVVANLIYVDADHSSGGCHGDMSVYYPLLGKGGVMFGDDYTEEPGVTQAVKQFSKPFQHSYYHWWLEPKE